MVHTQILVHSWGLRTRNLALTRRQTNQDLVSSVAQASMLVLMLVL